MTHATEEKTKLPNLVVGYSDGTVRMFDLQKLDMVLKMHPHPVSVTAITFSADGQFYYHLFKHLSLINSVNY